MVDLEPSTIDEVLAAEKLYREDQFVSAKGEAAHTYARGRYELSSLILEPCLDSIRK